MKNYLEVLTQIYFEISRKNNFEILKVKPIIVNFAAPGRVTNKFLRQQRLKYIF